MLQNKFKQICDEFMQQTNEFTQLKNNFLKKIFSMSQQIQSLERTNQQFQQQNSGLLTTNRQLNDKIVSLSKSVPSNPVGEFSNKLAIPESNILDLISPEMLSTEETISIMFEILRRVANSLDMKKILVNSTEFHKLINNLNAPPPNNNHSMQKIQSTMSLNLNNHNNPHIQSIQFEPEKNSYQSLDCIKKQLFQNKNIANHRKCMDSLNLVNWKPKDLNAPSNCSSNNPNLNFVSIDTF